MKTCYNCRGVNRDNDKFCRNCGMLMRSNFYYVLINIGIIIAVISLIFIIALFVISYLAY